MKKTILQSPIAIVGMSCRLPDADGLDEYWQLLVNGHDAITEMPADRLDRQLYFDKNKGTRGRTYSTIGGLIKDRPVNRDICPFEDETIRSADPCHLIFCEVAATACVHAGWDLEQIRNSNTGVFVGHSAGSPRGGELAFGTLAEQVADYLNDIEGFNSLSETDRHDVMRSLTEKLRERRPSRSPDNNLNVGASEAAHLVSRTLGLTGPSMVVDAACASSLVALSMGIMALQAGEIDSAIIGGASLNKADSLILFSHAQSCTAEGTRPFDDRADGLANSEGYVALVIKLLEDAVADGDEIHGVIRGIGISSDGRGRSLWAPRKEGQVEAISRAYRDNLDASRVQYVEAHATSTRVGDATELESLGEFFRPFANGRKLPIGSVKSNIGHTLETAGLAGLLKTLLAMKHGVIPPTANLQKPSEAVDWNQLPFLVPTKAIPWRRPQENLPRRAAVNAFGIGGLNCHVVIDQSPEPGLVDHSRVIRRPEAAESDNRVAIIGRGVVLPDAHDREAFAQLLASGRSAIKQAPADRWRNRIGIHPDRGLPWHSPTGRGGFIVGYEYDWKRFKIPPKQIAQANPLQFMLLDAAEQALAEAGLEVEGAATGRKPFDRVETAVVVGGSFAGDFGNQLQIGLRLPEMRRDLQRMLSKKGMASTQIAELLDQFESNILKQYPALIDETGSFTSSTLASRLTKTLNLMGGAMAIDATDASSYSAISVASNLLKTGACSQVLCCAAQRSMDLAGFEWLASQRRLQGTNSASPGDGHLPGEGVAVILMKRYSDAVRDGDRIFGVFDSIGACFDEENPGQAAGTAIARANESSRSELQFAQQYASCGIDEIDSTVAEKLGAAYEVQQPTVESPLHEKVGHLQAAHGLASVVAATLQHETSTTLPATFTSRIRNGMTYHVALDKPLEREPREQQKTPSIMTGSDEFAKVIRIGATSHDGLRTAVTTADPNGLFNTGQREFTSADAFRVSLVSHNAAEVASQLKLAAAMMDRDGAAPALQQKGIYVGSLDQSSKIAFLFPGQGSQYPDMMRDVIASSAAARRCVDQANQHLAEIGRESFQQFTREPANLLHSDLETTQLAVLIGNMIMLEVMREQGVTAACVSGHSFGEVAALVATEAITLRDAIHITRARTESILSHPSSGGLLSLVSHAVNVQQLVHELNADVVLTHFNAPEQ
ncbi:MAG: beta-ketoacyl synthase N-terminal-like domain-containing protein, partial [Planctomycetota bacterium]